MLIDPVVRYTKPCKCDIAEFGTAEQHQLHEQTLQNAVQYADPNAVQAFEILLEHFKGCVQTARNSHRFTHHFLGNGHMPAQKFDYVEQQ